MYQIYNNPELIEEGDIVQWKVQHKSLGKIIKKKGNKLQISWLTFDIDCKLYEKDLDPPLNLDKVCWSEGVIHRNYPYDKQGYIKITDLSVYYYKLNKEKECRCDIMDLMIASCKCGAL